MHTDLFVAAAKLDACRLSAAIPPACWRAIDPHFRVTTQGEEALVDLPEWEVRRGARHLVPAFSPLADAPCTFRFEVSVVAGDHWTPWAGTVSVGPRPFETMAAEVEGISADVDLFRCAAPIPRVRLRLRVHPAAILDSPWMATLSACDLDTGESEATSSPAPSATRLTVPSRSQMEEAPALRERVCSPTSVAMVLEYWGCSVEVGLLAAEVYHPALDIYGVWPAAIGAGARRGIAGYLLRFPSWSVAAWCLDRQMPIIASVRYEAGELRGSAVPRTNGHLLVLTGHDGDHVLVNDPAAPSRAEVPRRYHLDDLRRVWLDRSGVGYVFFTP